MQTLNGNHQQTSGFDVTLGLARILVQRKRGILIFAFLCTAVAVAFVFLAPSAYKAIAIVKPPRNQSGSGIESLLKESGGNMAGLIGSFIGGDEQGLNDCQAILNSTRFARLVIDRFDLLTRYKFLQPGKPPKKIYFADVLKKFNKMVEYDVTDEGALSIAIRDKSPEMAKDMVAFMIKTLDSLYIDMQRVETKQRLEYVDKRLVMAETDMKNLEDSLVAFQSRNNLFLPEMQVQFILENAAQTEVQIESVKEDLALEGALRGNTSSRYRDLMVQKQLLQKSLQGKMKHRADSNSLVLPARTLPALATEYFRLDRAYKMKLGLYKYLVQQVEALKLDADKNMHVLSVIDAPWVNDKRVSPKRRLIVEAVFVLSLLIGSFVSVLLALWDRRKAENPALVEVYRGVKAGLFKL